MFIKNYSSNNKNTIMVSPNTHTYLSHLGFSPIAFVNKKYVYLKTKELVLALKKGGKYAK